LGIEAIKVGVLQKALTCQTDLTMQSTSVCGCCGWRDGTERQGNGVVAELKATQEARGGVKIIAPHGTHQGAVAVPLRVVIHTFFPSAVTGKQSYIGLKEAVSEV